MSEGFLVQSVAPVDDYFYRNEELLIDGTSVTFELPSGYNTSNYWGVLITFFGKGQRSSGNYINYYNFCAPAAIASRGPDYGIERDAVVAYCTFLYSSYGGFFGDQTFSSSSSSVSIGVTQNTVSNFTCSIGIDNIDITSLDRVYVKFCSKPV